MRIQVELDVRRPLRMTKKVRLHGDISTVCSFKYERLQTFCYICGIMGHAKKYCETHYHLPANKITRQWNDSIRAEGRNARQKQAARWLKNPNPPGGARSRGSARRSLIGSTSIARPIPANIQALEICSGASIQSQYLPLAYHSPNMEEEEDLMIETLDDRKRRRDDNDHMDMCSSAAIPTKASNSPKKQISSAAGARPSV
ncbi:hypothetical protein LINGRAHAP2_LOCUS34280 [Linum grandiflorum]